MAATQPGETLQVGLNAYICTASGNDIEGGFQSFEGSNDKCRRGTNKTVHSFDSGMTAKMYSIGMQKARNPLICKGLRACVVYSRSLQAC